MLVFWEHGYEGASLATLTEAMSISTTSVYAAFGNKEEPSAKLWSATAKARARTWTARWANRPPPAGDSGQTVRDLLASWRNNGTALLAHYVTTLAFGIAVQAASGVSREELQAMADAAPRNWPLC